MNPNKYDFVRLIWIWTNRRDEHGITDILADPMVQQRKRILLRATSFENEVDVVGFEDDFMILLAELVREDPVTEWGVRKDYTC